ncbi:MAG: hypothetical protein HUU35_02585 [Armatimonadetes bacterium]|nr:hypothetical protein [Armatimonadota bacterium]
MWITLLANTLAAPGAAAPPAEVVCDGRYSHHLQGVAGDGVASLYWSFTTALVKTDLAGRVLAQAVVPFHHGDLCLVGDLLHVAWSNYFNRPGADSKVYIYRAADLSLVKVVRVPEVSCGAGGLDYDPGRDRFYLIGGLPEGETENPIYEYDAELRYLRTIRLPSGYTKLGIQTACFHDEQWWFGCYRADGTPGLLTADRELKLTGRYDISPAIGLLGWGPGRFLMAEHFGEQWQARLVPMQADEQLGLARVK